MATIDNKAMIDEIIAKNGYYCDDPRVFMIVEYINAFGNKTWGVTWVNESQERRFRYLMSSRYVRNPVILWDSRNSK